MKKKDRHKPPEDLAAVHRQILAWVEKQPVQDGALFVQRQLVLVLAGVHPLDQIRLLTPLVMELLGLKRRPDQRQLVEAVVFRAVVRGRRSPPKMGPLATIFSP